MQKLAEICVRRPVFATMLILSLTVVGVFSFRSLGVDLFPKIDLPTITVTVVNRGASPQEIETEITDKVEGAGKQGVVVTKVDPKSAAADRGFKKGDVILEVAGKSVATPNDVREALEAARTDKKSSALIRLRSGDARHRSPGAHLGDAAAHTSARR